MYKPMRTHGSVVDMSTDLTLSVRVDNFFLMSSLSGILLFAAVDVMGAKKTQEVEERRLA